MADILALLQAELGSIEENETTMMLGGTALKLFAKPMTAADITIVSRKNPNFLRDMTLQGMVDMLIHKCRDADGQKVFTLEHRALMLRLKLDTVSDAFGALFSAQIEDIKGDDEDKEIRKGKSKPTS